MSREVGAYNAFTSFYYGIKQLQKERANLKILAFGDLHAHPFKDFSTTDEVTGNTRLTAIVKTLEYMGEYARDNDIDLILDAGDIFHKRNNIDTVTYNSIFEAVKNISDEGTPIVMIPGNHTQVDNSDFPETSIEPFGEIENVSVLKEFSSYSMGEFDVDIYPAPYSKNADMVKKYIEGYAKEAESNKPRKSILLGHLGVTNAEIGKGSFTMEDAFTVDDLKPDVFDWVVLGHFHKRQTFKKFGHPNAFYTGNPIQHNFNDEGQAKGFMVIDTDKGEAEFVEIPNKQFLTVTDLKDIENTNTGDYFIRCQITEDQLEELEEKLPDESDHRIELTKDYDEDRRMDLDFSNSFTEMVEEYATSLERPDVIDIGKTIINEATQEV